ncbi:MAG TPA: MerR family transcriptional regulator [Chloroflexia bacterium]|nr:MerR family transcriptional regulator [Chloroflexia bacterium]
MNINELANETGVTTRTIRYYVEQGLLPNPEAGYPAQYTDDHLQRLALIRRLKEEYLPLDEIRTMLQGLNAAEITALLAEHDANPPPAKTANLLTSASEYINQVLGRGVVREQLKQNYVPQTPAAAAQAGEPPPVPRIPPAAQPATASMPPPAAPPVPPSAARRERSGPSPQEGATRGRQLDQPSDAAVGLPVSRAAAMQQGIGAQPPVGAEPVVDTWQRIVLLPGVELHIAVREDRRFNRIVGRLLDAAHRILAEEPEKAEENL